MKARYTEIDKKINEEYFNSKIDLIPATIRDVYADFVSKDPRLVRRELVIGDRVFLGVEYGADGKTVINAYTSDKNGKLINIENEENTTELPTRPTNIKELYDWQLKSVRDSLNSINGEDKDNEQPKKSIPNKEDTKRNMSPIKTGSRSER